MAAGSNGSRMTGEERERLMLAFVRRYRAGETVAALATSSEHAEDFVERLLREAGVALPRQGHALAVRGEVTVPAGSDSDPEPAAPTSRPSPSAQPSLSGTAAGAPDLPAVSEVGGGVERTVANGRDGARDPDRSLPPLNEWGLPTPPLRVLVKKKPKAREKALAAATARRKRDSRAERADDRSGASFAGKKPAGGKKSSDGKKSSGAKKKPAKKSKKSGDR